MFNSVSKQRGRFLSKLKELVPNLQEINTRNNRNTWKGEYQEKQKLKYIVKFEYDSRGDRLSFTRDESNFLNINLIIHPFFIDVDRDHKQILEDEKTRKILEDVKELLINLDLYRKID